jgi:MFS family permease
MVGLFLATATGSAGLAAGGTAGALLAKDISGSGSTAGWPLGVLIAGSATSVLAISRRSGRWGYGRSLSLGYALGVVGAIVVVLAAVGNSFIGLLAGSFVLGSASATVFFTRYAAAELGGPDRRGRSLGSVLFATALGATTGPALLGPTGRLAETVGLPPLCGLYLVAIPAFTTAALILSMTADSVPARAATQTLRWNVVLQILRGGGGAGRGSTSVGTALAVLAVANLVMVGVMAIAPVTMGSHGHGLRAVGLVVSIHVAGMFGPSPISGWLADRFGPRSVTACGFLMLAIAGVSGAVVDQDGLLSVVLVLGFIGVGWNFSVVGGSAHLVTSVAPPLRPQMEGIGDVVMSLAGAAGAPAAGLIAGSGSYAILSLAGAGAALLGLAIVRRSPFRDRSKEG